jgi:hypothetical protein
MAGAIGCSDSKGAMGCADTKGAKGCGHPCWDGQCPPDIPSSVHIDLTGAWTYGPTCGTPDPGTPSVTSIDVISEVGQPCVFNASWGFGMGPIIDGKHLNTVTLQPEQGLGSNDSNCWYWTLRIYFWNTDFSLALDSPQFVYQKRPSTSPVAGTFTLIPSETGPAGCVATVPPNTTVS